HGAYMTDEKAYDITHNPNALADLLLQAGEQLKQKDLVIKEMQPKALFADAVETSHTSILIGELAKILKQNGVETGQNRLFQWLRDKGYLI
ncbi:phage antirepressor KilAC domain-containing protein, partial [Streptococcus pasteurianus]